METPQTTGSNDLTTPSLSDCIEIARRVVAGGTDIPFIPVWRWHCEPDGNPVYFKAETQTIRAQDDADRPPVSLDMPRRMGLVPSETTVLGILARPLHHRLHLRFWAWFLSGALFKNWSRVFIRFTQSSSVSQAALTTGLAMYYDAVSALHRARAVQKLNILSVFGGVVPEENKSIILKHYNQIASKVAPRGLFSGGAINQFYVSKDGFGGRCDWHITHPSPIVAELHLTETPPEDIKTNRLETAYFGMKLAAHALGLNMPIGDTSATLVIYRPSDSSIAVVDYPPSDVLQWANAFRCMLSVWKSIMQSRNYGANSEIEK